MEVPDVAFVAYERWRPLPDDERQEPRFAPDVAVEVRSPDDRQSDVVWKVKAYLEAGALLVIEVLPEERRIVAHARSKRREFREQYFFECPAVPWLRFPARDAFADLEPGE